MSDWLDDLYESGGYSLSDLPEVKRKVIDAVVAEFDVYGKSKVRLRWIEQKLELVEGLHSADMLEIYYKLLETGKYDGTLFKYQGRSDILIWRKPWHERNPVWDRFRTGAISAIFSLSVGLILWLLANQKQSQAEVRQELRIDSLSDSIKNLQKHIMDSARHK